MRIIYRLILIDADDTLFDYPKAEEQALYITFSYYNSLGNWTYKGELLTHESLVTQYKKFNHQLWLDFEKGQVTADEVKNLRFKRLFDYYEITIDSSECSKRYLYELSQGRFLFDGALELCKYLHSKATVVIVTNGFKEVQVSRIKESPLNDYIDAIIISEEVGASKPDPRIFEEALRRVGHTDKSEVLMIGDSLSADMMGGINFGIHTCWYNPKKLRPISSNNSDVLNITYSISDFQELVSILEEVG